MIADGRDFSGAKIILYCNGALVTYLRDDKPGIPFPALWDLPGGGAEINESPKACVMRETYEEFGLHLDPARITWERKYASALHKGMANWFFAAPITQAEIAAIQFGDEGQYWRMMPFNAYITHTTAVPHLQEQVRDFLAQKI
mgnify:CR=1 FL=1